MRKVRKMRPPACRTDLANLTYNIIGEDAPVGVQNGPFRLSSAAEASLGEGHDGRRRR